MCEACGETYQTTDDRAPRYATDVCSCQRQLMPPRQDRVGDSLGLSVDVGVLRPDGTILKTPTRDSVDWTARPVCYLCFRWIIKHRKGRGPVGN